MPVAGPRMSPRHFFVQLLALEVGVGDAEAMVAAEFQQFLTVLIQLANNEMAKTGGPCLPVGSYACGAGDLGHSLLQGLVKLIFGLWAVHKGSGVNRQEVDKTGRCLHAEGKESFTASGRRFCSGEQQVPHSKTYTMLLGSSWDKPCQKKSNSNSKSSSLIL